MSGSGFRCVDPGQHRAGWWVECYQHNHSAFNGYRVTRSRYSRVRCSVCGRVWRTAAAYVDDLPASPDYREVHG